MAKFLFCWILTAHSIVATAQQNRFIYIQTENKQPFYIKLDKKVFSSSNTGYVIIPQLTDGSYNLQVGFPKNEWPEQIIRCAVDKKDAGYMLKNFGDKGWGLFNLQTLEVLMAGSGNGSQTVAVENKKDEFSNLLSNVVNDSSIRQTPVAKPPTAPPAVVVKETPPPVATTPSIPPSKIKRELYINGKQGAEMIYTDNNGGKTDTIRILIPADKEQAAAPVTAPPTVKEEKPVVKEAPPVVKEDKPTVQEVQPPVKEEKPMVKEEKPAPKEQFINIELPNPATKQPEVAAPAPPVKKVAMVNSNCRNHANEDDFMKIRKKMVAEDNDDDMVAAARKILKTKCFTTEQIKNLGVLFLKDEGRYKFFDAAYPFVSDTDNFNSLEAQLTEEYYINRFKAMVRH
jgi:hypothetical protein